MRRALHDGAPTGTWNLLAIRGGPMLSWHPRVASCKRGFAWFGWRNCGLRAVLNLPLIGDFGLWR